MEVVDSPGGSTVTRLRLMTYLSPGIPVELYQIYQRYLEKVLGCDSCLMVESRWSGPPDNRPNPFTEDHVDIGFVCSTSYLKMAEMNHLAHVQLLPVAPIHLHEKSDSRPIYFSDVIIRKEKVDLFKTFYELKGHRWAYNEEGSLSGNCAVLAELKRMGFNASFFGDILYSGSHHNSIKMVRNGMADAAAIDSNVLRQFYVDHPEFEKDLTTLTSLGPLPIQPIVINSRLPEDVKKAISAALLDMNKTTEWRDQLAKFRVWGFKAIDHTLYDKEKDIMEIVKDQKLHTTYY